MSGRSFKARVYSAATSTGFGTPGGALSCAIPVQCGSGGTNGTRLVGPRVDTPIRTRSYAFDGAAQDGGSYRLTATGEAGETLFSVFGSRSRNPFRVWVEPRQTIVSRKFNVFFQTGGSCWFG